MQTNRRKQTKRKEYNVINGYLVALTLRYRNQNAMGATGPQLLASMVHWFLLHSCT